MKGIINSLGSDYDRLLPKMNFIYESIGYDLRNVSPYTHFMKVVG